MKSASNGGVLKGCLQVLHIHVFLVAPLDAGYMPQPGADHHEGRVAVWEATHHTGTAADLPVQSFNHIVGVDTGPVFAGEIAVSKSLLNAILHLLSCLLQFHRAQFLHHGFSLLPGCLLALLSMDCLEHFRHQFHLGERCDREHISVKVNDTLLVFGLRKHFSYGLQHIKALVSNNEFYPIQATTTQPLEEVGPAGLVFFHFLGCTKNLPISVFVHRNSYQNRYIFKLTASITVQIDPIHIDIRITPVLQRTVAPIFDVDIGFFGQLTNGGWRNFAVPQGFCDVLHAPHRYFGKVHLNKSFFHAALTASIPLNNSSLKRNAFEFGHF